MNDAFERIIVSNISSWILKFCIKENAWFNECNEMECYLGQGPSAGTSKVIQHGQKEEKKKIEQEESIQQN